MPFFDLPPDELTRLAKAEGFDLAGIAALDKAEEAGKRRPREVSGRLDRRRPRWRNGLPQASQRARRPAAFGGQGRHPLGALGHRLRRELQRTRPALHRPRTCSHRVDRPLRLGRPARPVDRRAAPLRLPRHSPGPSAFARIRAPRPHRRGVRLRCYVDTGPLIERDLAHRAGIGWTAKNTCTLNQQLGSWLFLCCIVTSLEVAPAALPLPAADRCGTCRRCIEACPTDALIAPRQMDASRCIAYLTIEKRGPIPEELRAPIGRQVFGCDICQDVCPWNQKARPPRSCSTGSDPPRADQPSPRLARRSQPGRVQPAISRLTHKANKTQRIAPQRRHRHRQ